MLIVLPAQAEADEAATDVGSSLFTGDYLLQVVGSFFLVICVLLAVMLLLKRFNTVGTSKGGYIEILASAPLGQRERAVLLQVGEEQILVGVAPGNVTALHHISHPVSSSEAETSLTFKEVWNFARNRQGGNE
jgi:flagellar protein FliO/FliZ